MKINQEYLESFKINQHPFEEIRKENIRSMMANYFAMSQAFPYLQSGSQKDLYYKYMEQNRPIDQELEITSVVGNFLSWDETGGLYVTLRKKMAGISEILKTDMHFHSNYLRDDLKKIFGEKIDPEYSQTTKLYLDTLYKNLSELDAVKRCATMVSFEEHANQMINSLWESLCRHFPEFDKNNFKYFYSHVGGDDPAEAYHVKMTQEMIDIIADTEDKKVSFTEHFQKMYQLHVNWCRDIVAHA